MLFLHLGVKPKRFATLWWTPGGGRAPSLRVPGRLPCGGWLRAQAAARGCFAARFHTKAESGTDTQRVSCGRLAVQDLDLIMPMVAVGAQPDVCDPCQIAVTALRERCLSAAPCSRRSDCAVGLGLGLPALPGPVRPHGAEGAHHLRPGTASKAPRAGAVVLAKLCVSWDR